MIFDKDLLHYRKRNAFAYYNQDGFYHRAVIRDTIERLSFFEKQFSKILWLNTPPFLYDIAEWHNFVQDKQVQQIHHASFYPQIYPQDIALIPIENSQDIVWSVPVGEYDAILSPLGLHHVNDMKGFLQGVLSSLREDGVFIGSMVGEKVLGYFHHLLASLEIEEYDTYPHRIHPAVDVRMMGDVLQKLGFTLPVTDCFSLNMRYRHLGNIRQDVKNMGESRILTTPTFPITKKIWQQVQQKLQKDLFHHDTQKYHLDIDIICVTGRKYADIQQKPAKPLLGR